MSRHNEKRAARFEAAGIGSADLATSATSYYDDAGGNCALCDHDIKYRYLLTFHKDPRAVEFFPVGSKCITDWVKALPDSSGRQAALDSIKEAEREMRRQQKVLDALLRDGDGDGANLMRIFFRLPKEVQENDATPLGDIGQRVLKYKSFSSDRQRNFFGALVRKGAAAHGVNARREPGPASNGAQEAQATPAEVCNDDAEGRALFERYKALGADYVRERGGALADIGAKVAHIGAFASPGQRRYFGALVDGAELLKRYFALPAEAREAEAALFDMGGKLERYGTLKSDKQRGYFVGLLEAAEALPPPPPAAETQGPAPVAVAEEDDEDDWEGDPF